MLIRLLLLVTLLFPINTATAEEDLSLILGGFSQHFGDGKMCHKGKCIAEFNEVNEAIGIEYKNWAFGTAILSYNNRSYFIYRTLVADTMSNDYVQTGMKLGLVEGYKDTPTNMAIAPIISPTLEFFPDNIISFEIGALPFSAVRAIYINFKVNL